MDSICHTLIVKFDKCPVPEEGSIREFISEKLNDTVSEIDYFGCEIDSGWDYVDETMKTNLLNSCFLTFQFEDGDAPKYGSDKADILAYMDKFFKENYSRIIIEEQGKDVDIYFD